eukprot:6204211-Pleurochrysis_carterae.AAC.3
MSVQAQRGAPHVGKRVAHVHADTYVGHEVHPPERWVLCTSRRMWAVMCGWPPDHRVVVDVLEEPRVVGRHGDRRVVARGRDVSPPIGGEADRVDLLTKLLQGQADAQEIGERVAAVRMAFPVFRVQLLRFHILEFVEVPLAHQEPHLRVRVFALAQGRSSGKCERRLLPSVELSKLLLIPTKRTLAPANRVARANAFADVMGRDAHSGSTPTREPSEPEYSSCSAKRSSFWRAWICKNSCVLLLASCVNA